MALKIIELVLLTLKKKDWSYDLNRRRFDLITFKKNDKLTFKEEGSSTFKK